MPYKNKADERAYQAKYYADPVNKAKAKAYAQAKHLADKYGLTPERYDAMLVEQDGKCAICGTTEAGGRSGRFHVDHDHATGVVRALLCNRCNPLIGLAEDDAGVLTAAIAYLERHGR